MKAHSALRFARCFTLAIALVGTASLAGCSAQADQTDDETPMSEDELRRQSEDLFKPTSTPVQSVPSTLAGVDHWDLYLGQTGTTTIGVSKAKKRKAIFVQLLDHTRGEQITGYRGTGYLVASDFRFDTQDKRNELRLLAEAIRKDLTPALDAVPVTSDAPAPVEGPLVANEPVATPPAATPTPTPAPTTTTTPPPAPTTTPTPASTPPAPTAPVAKQPPGACAKSTLKLILFGLSLVRDVTDVVVSVVGCQDDKAACASAVTSFTRAVWTSSTYKDVTCKR